MNPIPHAETWHFSKIGNNYDQYDVYSESTGKTVAHWVEGKPNAVLIATAPELMAALQGLLESPDLNLDSLEPETHAALSIARTAIAKAKGL